MRPLLDAEKLRTAIQSRFDLKSLAVGFTGFCAFLSLYATQPLLPMLQKTFHSGKLGVSLTVSAATLAVALAAPWVGILADEWGRKKFIVPSMYLLALVTVLGGTATSLPLLIFWRFLQGVLTPAVFAVTVAYVNEEWPRDEVGFATSVYVAGTVVGGFTGRFLAGMVATHFGWRWVFVVLGLLTLICAVATASWLPKATHFKRATSFATGLRNTVEHLKNRKLWVIYGVGFCILFSLVSTFTYITFYLADPPFHLRPAALGSIFFVYLIGAVITPTAGWWADRIPGRIILSFALLLSMVGVLLTLSQQLAWVVLGLACCSSGVFVCQIITNKTIGLVATQARASAIGLYVTLYYFGGFVGSIAPGLIWHRGAWTSCVLLVSSVLFLTFLFVLRCWAGTGPVRPHDSQAGPLG